MDNNIEVLVATHKPFNMFDSSIYSAIQVGAELTDKRYGYKVDNIKDNISYKNKNYCELTALYWLWKNSTKKIKGLCHYRRFLSTKDINRNKKYYLDKMDIETDLENYDIIIPKKSILLDRTCRENYIAAEGMEKDLENLKSVIEEIYPEYKESLIKILNGNRCSYCNVMIAKREIFDHYCEWLFTILFKLEDITDLSGYTAAQARVYGYLSEILLNVWIYKNELRVKEYTLINTEACKNYKYYMKLICEKMGVLSILQKNKLRRERNE